MKKIILLVSTTAIILAVAGLLFYLGTSNERVSREFAEQLFEYPLPEETSLRSKHQFNGKNFLDGGGSGGYWNVAAIMELSTTLTKEEVLAYYRGTELFLFPKGKRLCVELELYFEDDIQKVPIQSGSSQGYYYRNGHNQISTAASYPLEPSAASAIDQEGQLTYVLQLTSGFDYFFNLD